MALSASAIVDMREMDSTAVSYDGFCLIECICCDALVLYKSSHSVMKSNLVACFSLYLLYLQLLARLLKVCVRF